MKAAAAVAEGEAAPTWPRVIKLQHQIDFGGHPISELTFRRGKMGDARGLKLKEEVATDDLMLIASRMCGVEVAALAKLDIDDAGEVISIAMDFYVRYLGAGKTPSP